jgi:coenzyme F420-0:L-glutamate ligase/coenzyme F420-1:gamma-L-glutamate ligase
MAGRVSFWALEGIPEVKPGDDLATLIAAALDAGETPPAPRDIFIVAQKIVSKVEDRFVDLCAIQPSPRALDMATVTKKDPRLIEVILSESDEVIRIKPGVIVVAHRLGFVMANAGIDHSNLGPDGDDRVLLLPCDPDATANQLRRALTVRYGMSLGVIVSDSFGRAWRNGVVNIALGAAGLPALIDARGRSDRDGRRLEVTQIAFADAVAAGAALVMGESDEGMPVVLARGVFPDAPEVNAASLIRPKSEDLFR